MATLRWSVPGAGTFVFEGPKTGRRYVATGETVEVADVDISDLLKMKRKEGCGCTGENTGGSNTIEVAIFSY